MHRGVPLVHHLDRMRAEPLLAGRRPLIDRIGDETAEHADRLGVGADRRTLQVPQRPQVTQPLVHHPRRPRHGNASACAANALTVLSRRSTVVRARLRANCWFANPVNIASKTASSGLSNATPSTTSSFAAPGTDPPDATFSHL